MSATVDELFAGLGAWVAGRCRPSALHRYGAHDDQHAVLRLPDGPGPHPVAVVLHGGFWRATFTKANTEAVAAALAEEGWASWNVEYRRVGAGGGYPATLADIAAACQALAHVAAPLDLGKTVAVGHSAGGQLALWAAAERLVGGAVSLAGVSDLAAAVALGAGAAVELMGGTVEELPAAYADADPSQRLPLGVATLLVHGTADDRVPIAQSRRFAARARAAGDECRLLELPGAGHFAVIDPRSSYWPQIAAAIGVLLPFSRG
jgi:acetyl esterase/lipase